MSTEGNRIVPNPKEPLGFPTLVLAAVIVSAGIYMVDQMSPKAAWLLAFLVLLGVAFGYRSFGDELVKLLGGSPQTAQPGQPSGQASQGVPSVQPSDGSVLGPVGPIGG